jgi:hypothetical protein
MHDLDLDRWAIHLPGPEYPERLRADDPVSRILCLSFASGSDTLAVGSLDGRLLIWDVATKTLLQTLGPGTSPITSVALSADAAMCAAGAERGGVQIWDLANRRVRTTLDGVSGPVVQVAFDPEGGRLATRDRVGGIQVWDVKRGTRQAAIARANSGWYLGFSADGSKILDGFRAGTFGLREWDPGGALLTERTWPWLTGKPVAMAYDHQSRLIAVTLLGPPRILLFETEQGANRGALPWNSGPVRAQAVSNERGGLALASGADVVYFALRTHLASQEQLGRVASWIEGERSRELSRMHTEKRYKDGP